MAFWSFLDAMLAPACADVHTEITSSSLHSSIDTSTDSEPSWHNGFGTQADYQSPAESGDLFQSNDWSSIDTGRSFGGSGFGDDW